MIIMRHRQLDRTTKKGNIMSIYNEIDLKLRAGKFDSVEDYWRAIEQTAAGRYLAEKRYEKRLRAKKIDKITDYCFYITVFSVSVLPWFIADIMGALS